MRRAFKAIRVIPFRIVVEASLFDSVLEPFFDPSYGEYLFNFSLVFAIILYWQNRVIDLAR
jgi:hypothetical protein